MSLPHAVDVPVTNLDDEDDDLVSTPEELDPNVLRDDFDIDDTDVFRERSFLSKVKDGLARFTQRGYSKVPDQSMMNGIELNSRFGDADSFDLSDDEFIARRQKDTVISRLLAKSKKLTLILFIVGLVITVIVLAALLGKKNKSSEAKHHKTPLTNGTDVFYPTTIFISLDGFHPHYISEDLTPTLHEFMSKEYGAPYMVPSFPSSTFPNHWTLATGLYPESHGIVANKFYDPVLKKQFINVIPERSLDPVWWGGEPIWSTAEYQGLRTAIHMFAGSEVKFPKGNPTEVDPYNGTETLELKTQRILGWLDRPTKERPELIVSYVPTIDSLGHHNGIHGKEIEAGLKHVDEYIFNVTKGIADRNLTDIVNLVIVSDHGMSPTSNDRLVYLDDIVNITKIQYIDGWPLFGLRPYPEYSIEEVYGELQSTFEAGKGYNVYRREELPEEWNFGRVPSHSLKYDRIAPIWVIPEIGYIITTHEEMLRKDNDYKPRGVHGYNNTEVLMRAIFLGTGPYFKERATDDAPYKVKPFHNVEVYNILCDMLNLTPAKNNGTSNLISSTNFLPKDWRDPLDYPSAGFDVGKLMGEKATYDVLFRGEKSKATTTLEQKTKTTSKAENEKADKAVSTEEAKGASTQVEEEKTTPSPEKEAPKTSDDKDGKGEHKGFWEKIGDSLEDLEEDLEDLGEDIKEGAEDLLDNIEDAFDDHKGGKDNDDS
ncbi:Ectonucleotide pyrophosphatase/phosphodiesterase 1 [Cyberlindnera fabianii]|uniref:Ectonucleotide pyrophosphatase/phosphodiesterase 1 n=1 Tax=Cyberlindnera fabianii TaxID=36022 RepID=A0A1V2L603_CYBFA|nr:Ectonucleotide pyrophosphatase/phosphodiesterase 1 [Cyberlindnera fabianii]